MSKRAGVDAAAGAAQKRGRKGPVELKRNMVLAALQRSSLEEGALHVLSSAASVALPLEADVRHPFHERVIAMLGEEFEKITGSLEKRSEELRSQEAALTGSHATACAKLEEVQHDQEQAQGELQRTKLSLAQNTEALREARHSVNLAQSNLEKSEVFEAVRAVPALDEVAASLKEDCIPEEKALEMVQQVQRFVVLEESLVAIAPKAMSRSERHSIDEMAIQQLVSLVGKKRMEFQAIIDADAGARAGREESLVKARESLHAAKLVLLEDAGSFQVAQERSAASDAAVSEAKKAAGSLGQGLKKLQEQRYSAEVDVELHRDQAIAAFEELKNRKTEPAFGAGVEPAESANGGRVVAIEAEPALVAAVEPAEEVAKSERAVATKDPVSSVEDEGIVVESISA